MPSRPGRVASRPGLTSTACMTFIEACEKDAASKNGPAGLEGLTIAQGSDRTEQDKDGTHATNSCDGDRNGDMEGDETDDESERGSEDEGKSENEGEDRHGEQDLSAQDPQDSSDRRIWDDDKEDEGDNGDDDKQDTP